MRRPYLRKVLVTTAAFTILAITGFAAEVTSAGAGSSEVRERVDLILGPPLETVSDATGEARLELRIEEGRMRFRTRARAEGLIDDLFSLCVNNGFTDVGEAKGGGVDLRLEVNLETLSGLKVTIREGAGCDGEVVLEGTVP